MASTAKAGQTARQKARERRVALEAETKTRNDHIEIWAAATFTGMAERDKALYAAASAEDAMADGLIGLVGEGLTTNEAADLCEMTVGEVQKLMKRRRDAIGGDAGEPFAATRRAGASWPVRSEAAATRGSPSMDASPE